MITENEILALLEAEYRQEAQDHPTWPDKWNMVGLICAYQKRYDEALTFFNHACQVNLTYKQPFINRVYTLFEAGKMEEAIATEKNVPPHFPEDYYWQGHISMFFIMSKNYQKAFEYLNHAIEKEPLKPLWYHHRGIVNWLLHKYQPAAHDFTKALNFCPVLRDIFENYQIDLKEPENANLIDYINAFTCNPFYTKLINEIGMIFFRYENFDMAKKSFYQSVKIDLNLSEYYTMIGKMLQFQGDDEGAYTAYKTSVSLDSGNVYANMLLANEEVLRDNIQNAIQIYYDLVVRYPRFPDLRYHYGVLCAEVGDMDKAIEQLEISIKLNPRYVAPQVALAFNLFRLERYDKSLETYQNLIEQGIESADIYNQMGLIYLQQENPENGVKMFEQAYAVDSDFPSILYYWGLSLLKQGQTGQAIEKWELYLEKDSVEEFKDEVENQLARLKG